MSNDDINDKTFQCDLCKKISKHLSGYWSVNNYDNKFYCNKCGATKYTHALKKLKGIVIRQERLNNIKKLFTKKKQK